MPGRSLKDVAEYLNIRTAAETMKKGLLIAICTTHLAGLAKKVQPYQVEFRVATNLDEVDHILIQEMIDFVFLGYEHDSEQRLMMLANILTSSPSSEIHIMGFKSDPIPFITGILKSAGIE